MRGMLRSRVITARLVNLVTLLGRMRLLSRVIDVVVPYSVVARQLVSNAWDPPEQTALDGLPTLEGKYW